MRYYGMIDTVNFIYGFVKENDSRITDNFIKITEDYHKQLLTKQGQGLVIVSDNETVFTAKPNLYFVNKQGLWERKTDEEYEAEQAQKEKDRILELKMTRSDFFDGTIMAWGVDEAALLPLIESMVNSMPLDDRLKLKAMNNFKNALNFYRKHDLFNLLVNIPLQLSESVQVIITDEHLDKFFDEVAKGNKDSAWQYLPQPMAINQ